MKKKNRFLSMKRRLEDAMFDAPAASSNDATGFSPTLPENNFEAENLSSLLNVNVSKRSRGEKTKDSKENSDK